MPADSSSIRLIILANKTKPPVLQALDELRPWLAKRAQIVAELDSSLSCDDLFANVPPADLAIVLGGDGTLLAQARHVAIRDIPILGVNFGKLGFLAEYSLPQLLRHWDLITSGHCRTSHRLMINITVLPPHVRDLTTTALPAHDRKFQCAALNDAVITAGQPFRMIELELAINPDAHPTSAASCAGDGIIVSTPSGSTAYNLSAGGPIVSPKADTLCITPICPHSLAFRPIIISADDTVYLRVHKANPGTHLVIDGQVLVNLQSGDQVLIRRHPKPLMLIHNPELNYWQMLGKKMHWAAKPRKY